MALPQTSEAWTHGVAPILNAPGCRQFRRRRSVFLCQYLSQHGEALESDFTTTGVARNPRWCVNGYPNGNITTNAQALIYPDPAYYGHYLLSWTDSGGTGGIGNISSNPAIVYSGGNGSATVFGVSPAASGEVPGNLAVQSGGGGVSIEFAYGMLLKAVGTDSSLGPTNIKFTTTGSNYAGNLASGMTFQFNNLTGLPAGPNSDGSWTIYTIDNNNFGLLNSSSVSVGGITLNTSGTVGVNTEGIYSQSAPAINPALFGNWTGSNASNLIWCKKADLADITAGKLATAGIVNTWKNLSPAYIRFMDMLGTQNIQQPDYARRVTPSNMTWAGWGGYTPIAYWAGVMTNSSDTFTCPTNPSASPSSGAYVDNEVVIAQVGASGRNTTQNPKMGITGRAAAAPIYDAGPHLLNITMTGSVPPTNTTLSFVFTGGGLSNPFTYNYKTSTTVPGPASGSTPYTIPACRISVSTFVPTCKATCWKIPARSQRPASIA